MELFNLLAKLTLDASDFDKGIDEAQKKADSFQMPDDKKLNLDTKGFNDGLDDAKSKGSEFGSTIKEIFNGVKDAFLVSGVMFAISKVVTGVQQGIDLLTTGGDKIDKQSKKLNLSTKSYQELNYALGLSGSSINDLAMGMKKFTEIQGGKVTKDQSAAFEKLGISAEKANGQMKSAEDLMTETMYALADYAGDDRGLLAEAFFGKSADKFNALFEEGSAGIKAMRKEAEDLGLILSDQDIKNAAEYMDATDKLSQSVNALKMDLAGDIVPGLTSVANTITKIIAFFRGTNGDKSISEMFADDDKQLASDLTTIEQTSEAAVSLADKLLAMGDTAAMTAEQYEVWKGTAEALIGLVPSLGEVIDTETGQINGNTESIKANIKAWEDMAKAKALQSAKEKKWQEIVGANEDLINKQIDVNVKMAEIEGKRATAMRLMNEYLSDEQLGSERQALSGFSEVNAENWEAAAKYFSNAMYQGSEMGKALKEFNDSTGDLADLEKDAASLAEEVESAKQEYEAWSAAADQLFGTLGGEAGAAAGEVSELQSAIDGLPDEKHITISVDTVDGIPNAKGNWSVPYDGFPAILHRGERVLTASQARKYRDGEGGGTDYAAIGAMISDSVSRAFKKVNVLMNGDKVGDLTTKRIKKNVNASSYSRQRAYGG